MSKILTIFTDGGARGNPGPAGVGVHVINDRGEVVFQLARAIGHATNNQAEYKAVLASLEWLQQALLQQPIERVEWRLDSLLVVEQLNKKWKIRKNDLLGYATEVWQTLNTMPFSYSFSHVPREENVEADKLVNQAIDSSL